MKKTNKRARAAKGTPEYMYQTYANARNGILLAIILTVINIALAVLGADVYLLFSIAVPYYGIYVGMGMDYWGGHTWTIVMTVIGLVILAVYFLLWLRSKTKRGVMLPMLVMFIIDSVVLLGFAFWSGYFTDFLLDILFHALILVYLVQAVRYGGKLTVYEQSQAQRPAQMQYQDLYAVPAEYQQPGQYQQTPSQYRNNRGPEID